MQTSKTLLRIVTVALAATLIVACSEEAKKTRFLAEANNYFKIGDYDKAKVSYLNVVRLDPQNAFAFERIGTMWLEGGAPLRAVPFLARASELDPNNAEYHIRLARSYLGLGRLVEVKKQALQVLELFPDHSEGIVVLTEAAQSKEDLEEAAQHLQKFPKRADPCFYLASANLLLRQGDLSSAENALRQALIVDPKSPAAHTAMGDLDLIRKDPNRAGEEFKTAADLAPIRSIERLKYAAFKSGTGDTEEVRKVSTEMTRKAPDYLPGWCLLSEVAFKEKKYDEALSLLQNVFSRDPQNLDGHRLESEVMLAKGDTKKAIEILERLDQTYPGSSLIKYQLAETYLKENNMNQAKMVLNQAISTNPNYVDAILLLAQINLMTGHSDMVIEPMTRLLKRQPDLRTAATFLAAAYGSLDRFDDATTVLEEQAKLAPQDPQPQMALGLTLRQAKKYDDARKAFEKASQHAPRDARVVNQLVELDLLSKHFDAARQTIQRHFQEAPDSAGAHFFEGKILAAEQKWDSAKTELEKTLQLDQNFPGAYDLLVQTYVATGELPEAVRRLEAEVSKRPNDPAALMRLATVYERIRDYSKAREAYDKILSINPKFVPALNNLACIYADRLDDVNKAYGLARRACDLEGHDPVVGDTMGWVLYKRGDYKAALPILEDSAAKLPDSPEVQFHLGMTAYMMGQTDLARGALQKAANAPKEFLGKEESKRRLALLNSDINGSQDLSLVQLEAMTKNQPKDVISQMRLAEAYEKQGAFDKAAAAFEQAFQLNPGLVSVVTRLAQLYAGPLHDKEKALIYAKQARQLTPGDPQVTRLLGEVAYQNGNFSWSYSLLQETARQGDHDPSILHQLAWAAYSMGKVNEARGLMHKAITIDPQFAEVADAKRFLSFIACEENPKVDAAAANEVQKQLQANPEYVPALMAEAAIDQQRGQRKPAAEIYTEILRRLPDFTPAQKRLAMLYAQESSTTSAAYHLAAKAHKTLPDDAELTQLLGRLSYGKRQYPRAIQLFQESAQKRPLDADSLFCLGMSQLQSRQKTEAIGTLNQALLAGLQEPLATEAKQALAETQAE